MQNAHQNPLFFRKRQEERARAGQSQGHRSALSAWWPAQFLFVVFLSRFWQARVTGKSREHRSVLSGWWPTQFLRYAADAAGSLAYSGSCCALCYERALQKCLPSRSCFSLCLFSRYQKCPRICVSTAKRPVGRLSLIHI